VVDTTRPVPVRTEKPWPSLGTFAVRPWGLLLPVPGEFQWPSMEVSRGRRHAEGAPLRSGTRWNRTTDISKHCLGWQGAGKAIGMPSDLPVRARTSQEKTGRATSLAGFGHGPKVDRGSVIDRDIGSTGFKPKTMRLWVAGATGARACGWPFNRPRWTRRR
jgi:hypothetical protein